MKTNLQSIKAALEYHWKHQDKLSYDILKEKLEGFEKELREILRDFNSWENLKKTGFADDLIKEILGVE